MAFRSRVSEQLTSDDSFNDLHSLMMRRYKCVRYSLMAGYYNLIESQRFRMKESEC